MFYMNLFVEAVSMSLVSRMPGVDRATGDRYTWALERASGTRTMVVA